MEHLKAQIRLSELPAVIDAEKRGEIKEIDIWSTPQQRQQFTRDFIEGIALSGMDIEELHVFLRRASNEAVKNWNNEQSFVGRIINRMTVETSGYAQVPGRVLTQILNVVAKGETGVVSEYSSYYLRADIAVEFRDQVAALLRASA